jgi:ATP-dependent Clp protease ATP-binding subunit ClpA
MSKPCCDTKTSLQSQVDELTHVVNQTAVASHHNTNLLLNMLQQQQLIIVYLLEKLEISSEELQAFAAAIEDSKDPAAEETPAEEANPSLTSLSVNTTEYPPHAAIFGG